MARPLGTPPLLGISLQPDARFLALARRLIEEDVDFFEVSPEQLWAGDGSWRSAFLEIARRSKKPFVAHGLGLSLGGTGDAARLESWLARIREDHAAFGWRWYSEHLGWVESGGLELALPLPLPPTPEAVRAVAERLGRVRSIVPDVAFENSANYLFLGDARRTPDFLNAIAREADCGIVLDLHNAYVECRNEGLDLDAWLDAVDPSRVVELHVSGGSESDAGWLASRRVFRLDSHDGPVPEPVWRAFERILPRLPNLRGVVVERIADTVGPGEIAAYEAEVARAREVLCSQR